MGCRIEGIATELCSDRDRRDVVNGGKSTLPDKDVAFFLDHDKVGRAILMLSHERMWY